MTFLRSHVSTVIVAGVVAVVCSAGGAVAGGMITGAQIKNGTVTGADVRNRSLGTVDLTRSAISGLHGQRGLRGLRGLTGQRGAAGAVRGWAHVAGDGSVLASSPGVTVVRSDKSDNGSYCVTLPGVDPAKTAPVASLDYALSTTSLAPNAAQGFVEVGNVDGNCAANQVAVDTLERTYTTNSGGQLIGTDLEKQDEAFDLVVP